MGCTRDKAEKTGPVTRDKAEKTGPVTRDKAEKTGPVTEDEAPYSRAVASRRGGGGGGGGAVGSGLGRSSKREALAVQRGDNCMQAYRRERTPA